MKYLFDPHEHFHQLQKLPGEPVVCAHFGCGKKLTRQEQLFGKKCLEHSRKTGRIDPMKVIKWPEPKQDSND